MMRNCAQAHQEAWVSQGLQGASVSQEHQETWASQELQGV